jgi:hypothetical protein
MSTFFERWQTGTFKVHAFASLHKYEPVCHSNKKLLGRFALELGDCCCRLRAYSIVSLFLLFAAEIRYSVFCQE